MKAKTLIILALITALVGAAALVLIQSDSETAIAPKSDIFFPHLLQQLDTVQQITLKTANEDVTLAQKEGQWGLVSRQYYPVLETKVYALLLGLAELKRLEPGTENPELYHRIGVEPLDATDAKSVLVTLKTAEDTVLSRLLIGNKETAKVDASRDEIYVREPDATQSWRVLGSLPLERQPTHWLEREIIHLPSGEIQTVTLQPAAGETIQIRRETREQTDYSLLDLPPEATLKTAAPLNLIASLLSNLELNDVQAISTLALTAPAELTAEFTQFDGFTVTMTVHQVDGQRYALFSATAPAAEPAAEATAPSTDEPATDAEAVPTPVERAAELNQRWDGWAYLIPDWKLERVLVTRDSLYEFPSEEAATEGESVPAEWLVPPDVE